MRGISQIQLASGTRATAPHLSMVEHGRANLSVANLTAAAKALGVSVDFLCGLTKDPTPARQLAKELADTATRVRDLEEQQAYVAEGDDGDYVGVSELAGAAGGGAVVHHERITGRVKFRREWLARHGLAAGECRVIHVLGESMEPTLVDGCSILVNQASQRRRVGHIFVVRTDDGLVVKRARQGSRRRLAAPQRQPEQAGVADHALARRRARDRRGHLGSTDVSMRTDPMHSIHAARTTADAAFSRDDHLGDIPHQASRAVGVSPQPFRPSRPPDHRSFTRLLTNATIFTMYPPSPSSRPSTTRGSDA